VAVSTEQHRERKAQAYDLQLPCRPCREIRHGQCEGRGRCCCHECMATRAYANPDMFTKRELASIAFDGARRAQAFRQPPRRLRTTCAVCGGTLTAQRRSKRYCSGSCAKAAQRARRRQRAAEAAAWLGLPGEAGAARVSATGPPAAARHDGASWPGRGPRDDLSGPDRGGQGVASGGRLTDRAGPGGAGALTWADVLAGVSQRAYPAPGAC
jgi:predicted nucleic acid-binding Zn ribbon protein